MSRDVLLVLIGAALGIPVAVGGNFLTDRVRRRQARRSRRQSELRQAQLREALAEARALHEEPMQLILFIVVRLLVVNSLWVAQTVVDYVFGIVVNASFSFSQFTGSQTGTPEKLGQAGSGVGSLVGALLLGLLVRYGWQGYRVAERARNYEQYEQVVVNEIAQLESIDSARAAAQRS